MSIEDDSDFIFNDDNKFGDSYKTFISDDDEDDILQKSFIIQVIGSYANKEFLLNLINIILYPSNISQDNQSGAVKSILNFLKSLKKDINTYNLKIPKNKIVKLITIAEKILDIKEDSVYLLLNYDNVEKYFSSSNIIQKNLKEVKENRISNKEEFQLKVNELFNNIKIYNSIKKINPFIETFEGIKGSLNNNSTSLLNVMKDFRDAVNEIHSNFSNIDVFKSGNELDTNYIFGSSETFNDISDRFYESLKTSGAFYNTGYSLIDENLNGLETASVHLISGPTNAAKSIFLINILRNFIEYNKKKYDENDIVLFISLEDRFEKVAKRLLSIFGNYDNQLVKKYTIMLSEIASKEEKKENPDENLIKEIKKNLSDIIESAISHISNICKFSIRYCSPGSTSMTNITDMIDMLKFENKNVKAVFIDYVDLLIPSDGMAIDNNSNDYNVQGKVVQDMKNACNKYNIPIVTISQNNRGSSDEDRELDIGSLGDSWKKARFADNLMMVRKRDSLDIFSENVKKDIYSSSEYNNKALTFDEDNSFDDDSFSQDHSKYLIPFELKIVKAKDGDKSGSSKFMLFSKKNLRIYNKFEDYIDDYKKAHNPNKEMQKNISLLTSTETISLSEIDNIVNDDEDSNFVLESDIEDIDFEI